MWISPLLKEGEKRTPRKLQAPTFTNNFKLLKHLLSAFSLFFFFLVYLFLFSVHRCFACMHICIRVLNPAVTDRCELPRRCCILNLDPLEEWSVRLITEPSLQPPSVFILKPPGRLRNASWYSHRGPDCLPFCEMNQERHYQ